MKKQTFITILLGTILSYLVVDVSLEQKSKKEIDATFNNPIIASVDTLPKYLVEKDGVITPKGMKYHILVVPPDTTQNWKMQQILIEKSRKFHMLLPEIE